MKLAETVVDSPVRVEVVPAPPANVVDIVPAALPGGGAAAAVTTPHVAVLADEVIRTDPDAPGAAPAAVFTVAAALFAIALEIVAVPHTVAVPALVVTLADPTVPAVVDHDARVPPAATCVTVSTDPAAPGAA